MSTTNRRQRRDAAHGRRLPRRRALRLIVSHLREVWPEAVEKVEAGDWSIRLVPDGDRGVASPEKVGWAWWITEDEEAGDGGDVLGTCYVGTDMFSGAPCVSGIR